MYNSRDLVADFPCVVKIANYVSSGMFSTHRPIPPVSFLKVNVSSSLDCDFSSLQPLHTAKTSNLLPVEWKFLLCSWEELF